MQRATFGRLLSGTPDTLAGYRVTTIQIRDPDVLAVSGSATHLALVPDPGAPPLAGTVYALTAAEIVASDGYEGDNYRRVPVVLRSGRDAWVYVKA